MKARPILERLLLMALMTVALWAARPGPASAQEPPPCPPGQVCNPFPCDEVGSNCLFQTAHFTPTADTWTYVFDGNNAIKIGTTVPNSCPAGFFLKVDRIRISQVEYAARRFSQFADTVCNPSFGDGLIDSDCVFYRVHGNTAPTACYDRVDYKIFWNTPTIQGNKHDWLLLRAPCEDSHGDSSPCSFQPFSEDITTSVDRKPPVGTDPVVAGDADGMSDYIVAISNRHPHKGIPPTLP
jgi:hypothetical protein